MRYHGTHCPLDVCSSSVTSVEVPGHVQLLASSAYLNSSSQTTCSANLTCSLFSGRKICTYCGTLGAKSLTAHDRRIVCSSCSSGRGSHQGGQQRRRGGGQQGRRHQDAPPAPPRGLGQGREPPPGPGASSARRKVNAGGGCRRAAGILLLAGAPRAGRPRRPLKGPERLASKGVSTTTLASIVSPG